MNTTNARKIQPTPLKRALGLGSSGTGVHDWWLQRLTAVALVPLSIWFLFFLGSLVGTGVANARTSIGEPVNAGLLILLSACLFWHGALGLKVIIEDYVHTRWREIALLVALRFGVWVGALACIMAILAIWLGGPDTN